MTTNRAGAPGRLPLTSRLPPSRLLAVILAAAFVGYIGWKIGQSPTQALQFAFNGLSVGAVYALLALGFTLVYSTVWFFDLYYGAAAAIGAYGVFYLRATPSIFNPSADVNSVYLNVAFALVVAGVSGWAAHSALISRLRGRIGPAALRIIAAAIAVAAGIYTGVILNYPTLLHLTAAPAVGALTALVAGGLAYRGCLAVASPARALPFLSVIAIPAAALGAGCGWLTANSPGAGLYISWGVSCLLAGAVAVALYRGLYVYMRQRARSPLVMLVASLGILLSVAAFITIIFQSAPRALPTAFGGAPWTLAGANIKAFNVFGIAVAIAGFAALWLILKQTSFGRAVRAIGDDEEVSKVVGINTTVIIAAVFFIGALYAAMAGILTGHDTAAQPRMGLILLLKGWIASVVGGIGNLYGAILGGFVLGLVEQFGIWDLAGEWKDAISFILLVLFLSFWPRGLLPRR